MTENVYLTSAVQPCQSKSSYTGKNAVSVTAAFPWCSPEAQDKQNSGKQLGWEMSWGRWHKKLPVWSWKYRHWGTKIWIHFHTLPFVSHCQDPEQRMGHWTVCLYKSFKIRCKTGLIWAGIILPQTLDYRNTVIITLFLNPQTFLNNNEGLSAHRRMLDKMN